jgi:hypothetical protein
MLIVTQPLGDSEQIRRFGRLISDRRAPSVDAMATTIDELEAIRERLAEVEQRRSALEGANGPRSAHDRLLSRTPLENQPAWRYGAFYVFETKGAFDRFAASELYAATDGAQGLLSLTTNDFAIPGRAKGTPARQESGPAEREGES